MLISIITPTYNSASTLADTLKSVASQDYKDIEHIIVDGLSKDKTLEIAKSFPHVSKIISEKDRGIFDAMNKGIRHSTGEVIGILNSDDFFANSAVLSRIAEEISKEGIDAVYGDVYFVSPADTTKVVRNYSAKNFKTWKFAFGYTPPHPTFYAKKKLYDQYGLFNPDYKYAADYELMMRFMYKQKISTKYIDAVLAMMRTGGASNKNFLVKYGLNQEVVQACKANGVYTNMFILFAKYLLKINEFISPVFNRWIGKELK